MCRWILSNKTFFENRIQRLFDGLILIEEETGVYMYVQHMLKMSRIYTLAEILSKIFINNEGKLGT